MVSSRRDVRRPVEGSIVWDSTSTSFTYRCPSYFCQIDVDTASQGYLRRQMHAEGGVIVTHGYVCVWTSTFTILRCKS
jgi:hypothetical protein